MSEAARGHPVGLHVAVHLGDRNRFHLLGVFVPPLAGHHVALVDGVGDLVEHRAPFLLFIAARQPCCAPGDVGQLARFTYPRHQLFTQLR
ncbi:Uncharacterised protein [Mycobacteroides abscessus subsp. abscessus]|nr:Uncharacterised protein [Mycobacteroides abscessus subsp. abscessus]